MSPKSNSLAYEEMLADVTSINEVEFVPELSLLVSKRMLSTNLDTPSVSRSNQPILIRGSLTVSF